MQDQVSLVNLVVYEVGGVECWLLCYHDLKTVVHLSITHVCEGEERWENGEEDGDGVGRRMINRESFYMHASHSSGRM